MAKDHEAVLHMKVSIMRIFFAWVYKEKGPSF